MINAFRKIRQSIINKNAPNGKTGMFRKYWVYAIDSISTVIQNLIIEETQN